MLDNWFSDYIAIKINAVTSCLMCAYILLLIKLSSTTIIKEFNNNDFDDLLYSLQLL